MFRKNIKDCTHEKTSQKSSGKIMIICQAKFFDKSENSFYVTTNQLILVL
jgi:hypothetical protein